MNFVLLVLVHIIIIFTLNHKQLKWLISIVNCVWVPSMCTMRACYFSHYRLNCIGGTAKHRPQKTKTNKLNCGRDCVAFST